MSDGLLRIVVVDDEPHARADIVELLAADDNCTVVATCGTGAEAIAAVEQHDPDVLLLDIRMPGTDGFGVVDALDAMTGPYIIFVTAFDSHAIEAFRVRALDYLLKPVHPERLAEALDRAREQMATARERPANAYWNEILVRTGTRDVLVHVRDIDWIEADTYCVRLHAGTRTHVLRERMHVLQAHLDPASFARVHRSAIVNIHRVREIAHDGEGDHIVVLATGARIRTSHSRWLEFRDTFRARTRAHAAAAARDKHPAE